MCVCRTSLGNVEAVFGLQARRPSVVTRFSLRGGKNGHHDAGLAYLTGYRAGVGCGCPLRSVTDRLRTDGSDEDRQLERTLDGAPIVLSDEGEIA